MYLSTCEEIILLVFFVFFAWGGGGGDLVLNTFIVAKKNVAVSDLIQGKYRFDANKIDILIRVFFFRR